MDIKNKIGLRGSLTPVGLRLNADTCINKRKMRVAFAEGDPRKRPMRRQATGKLMDGRQRAKLSKMGLLIRKKAARTIDPNEQRTLVRYIKRSLKQISCADRECILQQVRSLLAMVEGATLTEIHNNLEQQEIKQDCSLNHGITNLLFYELCAQTLRAMELSDKALRHLKNCQYFSRVLKYDRYTLELCFKISDTHKERHQYKQCTVFLENALELAMSLQDRYMEMKALDNLGMCYYYKGNTRVADFYHTQMNTLEDSRLCDTTNSSDIFVQRERARERQLLDFESMQTEREPYYFGLKRALQSNYDYRNRENAENRNRQLIRYPVFHRTLSKIKLYMNREHSIGKIERTSHTNLAMRKRVRSIEGTDLLNQVLVTHRSDSRRDPLRNKNLNVILTKQLIRLIRQLSYIESLCTEA